MKLLFLDDDKLRHKLFLRKFLEHEVVAVYTAADAITVLEQQAFDAVFLDHDLGGKTMVDSHGGEPTGFTVAKWLTANPHRMPPRVFVHSYNPVGAQNIKAIIPSAILCPGVWLE